MVIPKKDFLLKNINGRSREDIFMLGKAFIPLGNLGEHHREQPSATIRNHYISTFRKLLFILPQKGRE